MPVLTDITCDSGSDAIGTFSAQLLSDSGGLTQFGAFIETLAPGGAASRLHWHAREDEMVHILDGQVVLREGDTETLMQPGDTATFKAGVAVGHCLVNQSTAPARYMVIGTRSGNDVVTYPETGETVTIADGVKTYRAADGTVLKTAPYHGA